MESIIVFFRDMLDGTLYIVVSIVCFILILICIWQLIRRSKEKKIAEEVFSASHVVIINGKGEKETVEIASSADSSVASSFPNINTDVHDIPVIGAVNNVGSAVPQVNNNKQVVMINPLEVASVSSTMNIIGATSAQQEGLKDNTSVTGGVYDSTNAQSSVATVSVDSQAIGTLGEDGNMALSQSAGSGSSATNNQNFTN